MNLCDKNIMISVVIPAYNVAKYLEQAVNSILKQTILPYEIIIIEDCSNDETYSVAMELAKNNPVSIKVYKQEENSGVSAARNKGIELAQSEWVLFMDADDIAEPALVEKECRRVYELQSVWKTPVVLVHSAYRQVTEAGKSLGLLNWKQVQPEEILGYELVRNHIISTSGVLVNKDVVLRVGAFNTALKYSEDWDLWLKLAQVGGFGYVDEPLVCVRRHDGNASGKLANMLDGAKGILKRYDVSFIERAIHQRKLSWEVNQADFIELLYRLDKWQEGYVFVSTLIDQHPSLASGYFLDSLYHLYYHSWDKAKQSLLSTIHYNPQHGAALNNLGAVLGIQGEYSQAKEYFRRASMLFPMYMDANHNSSILGKYSMIPVNEVKFTWRELRPVLLSYTE
ncbi:glycosyltransferase involved in cell wall biosynthesis [Sporomusaceae bacterium BoRhaA]|uniref:glycosyltransferase family 2 protein n=1 Tax=Pelorhabdus rhamnosifermentans TaxID=2772457 RepID=UPI001C05F3C8|nr:glycosyltransferase [Pelorhabdus rhamnosifermentans]MBU2699185.1 glycosyltransferase involved in cell wall biosynthesis [Pelorhabdus rhamnosifermentans]